ncbi:MAG: U32 family peptidase [Clostridia bacterium]|nr:U32 family peptidase [Clostridia bacterium]MBQ9786491.1 U32 family peptidase [Clostridia bacterium]
MELELLAPAGDKEKLETAFYYGADACYFAGKKWGLRAFSDNFENDELKEYVDYAHSLGKKAYITVNIQAHNEDFEGLAEYIKYLDEIKADAIIVSDAGILSLAKQVAPNLPRHLSTQACASNKYAAKFWADAGASRIILARELSLKEIAEIREFLPKEIELEAFVHGAMCISYSGRCLLSNYLANRDSNRGQCVQACRWQYFIREVSRDSDNELEIQEDANGTYILNSKDLCMVNYLDQMAKAGVTSFKIEGRMKSPYYVATVVNVYRRALDQLKANPDNYEPNPEWVKELEKSSHRKFTTGFCLGEGDTECIESSQPVSTADFIANIVDATDENGYTTVEQRNKFSIGEELEILSPSENFGKKFIVEEILDSTGNAVQSAIKVQEYVKIKTPFKLNKKDILRRNRA